MTTRVLRDKRVVFDTFEIRNNFISCIVIFF